MILRIVISLSGQQLSVLDRAADGAESVVARYPISSAALGAGERRDSFQTPRGRHEIAEKIGAGAPLHTVLRARKATGEIWSPELSVAHPDSDWILTRILWLSGCEPGVNSGGEVDTKSRYIYIHGTDEENRLGQAVSHGCIRMDNQAIIGLFDLVEIGTPVEIRED